MGGVRGPTMLPVPAGRRATVGADSKETIGKALERFKQFQTGMAIGSGYKLGHVVSSGTQGDVFTCSAVIEGRSQWLACKRVRTSKESICRQLLAEVAAIFHARSRHAESSGDPKSLGHPNIVGYLDWFAGPRGVEQEVYIAMERCEFALSDMVFTTGQLRGQVERAHSEARKALAAGPGGRAAAPLDPAHYRLTEREVVKVMHQMLSALAFLNAHGLMHRDIKSDNILWVAGKQPEGAYKLCDFGTAAFVREGEPGRRESGLHGTLWTMAPEMLSGRTHGPNCDIWSMGVVLFQLAALDYPFSSKELMAYQNSNEASATGSFWPAMCGAVGGAPPKGPGSPTSPTSPGRPKAMTGARTQPLARGSLPAPGAKAQASSREGAAGQRLTKSKTTIGARGKGRGLMQRTATAPGSLPTVADARAEALDAQGAGALCAGEGELLGSTSVAALPPLSPSAASAGSLRRPVTAEAADSSPRKEASVRKRAFLRKRSAFRWCYSEELQMAILEDMLEEAPEDRPMAGALLAAPRIQELAEKHLRSPPALLLTAEARAQVEEGAPASDARGGEGPSWNQGYTKVAVQLMRQVTGESYQLAMTFEYRQAELAGGA